MFCLVEDCQGEKRNGWLFFDFWMLRCGTKSPFIVDWVIYYSTFFYASSLFRTTTILNKSRNKYLGHSFLHFLMNQMHPNFLKSNTDEKGSYCFPSLFPFLCFLVTSLSSSMEQSLFTYINISTRIIFENISMNDLKWHVKMWLVERWNLPKKPFDSQWNALGWKHNAYIKTSSTKHYPYLL